MKQPIIGISPRYAFYKETNRHFLQVNTDYIDQIVNRNAITYFLCTFLFHKYETIGALSIFGLAMIFRVIGYFFDKMLAKK